jgi:hypothetical protein
LASGAAVFAANVAVHEELGGYAVQALTDFFANAHKWVTGWANCSPK